MNGTELRQRDALKFLLVARQADADPAVGLVYLTALADVDPAALEEACRQLALEPRQPYQPAMPDVGTIRARAERVAGELRERDRRKALPPAPAQHDDEPTFHCRDCWDESNGWAMAWCYGSGKLRVQADAKPERCARTRIGFCGRDHEHVPHEWAHRCHCYGMNPLVEKRRERQSQRRAEREKVA